MTHRELPDKIRGYRSTVINEIIDSLRALRPKDSGSIRHEMTADGTLAHKRFEPLFEYEEDFASRIIRGAGNAWNTVKVDAGSIIGGDVWSHPANTLSSWTNSAKNYVYLKTVVATGTGAITNTTLHATTSVTNYASFTTWREPICSVEVDGSGLISDHKQLWQNGPMGIIVSYYMTSVGGTKIYYASRFIRGGDL